jgi:cyclopropane fatty-acyl-phospholipid synthase-like methyltransferase
MEKHDSNSDKAGESYWTSFWKNYKLPPPIDLSKRNLNNYYFRKLDGILRKTFNELNPDNKSLIEIGCGNSVYLSYFNRQFGFNVSGLDYSEFGCKQTERILTRDNIKGIIIQGDLFNPPSELISNYDVACSFGVVEHFDDTSHVIKKISEFVRPGGLIITTIPNLTGLAGKLQKWMNKPVYDIHKVIELNELILEVRNAGLKVEHAEKMIPISFGITLDEYGNHQVKFKGIKKIIVKALQILEKIIQIIDDRIMPLRATSFFCAGMIVIARKPG